MKEIEKLKSENEDVKRIQGCAEQKIRNEVKDFVDNEVKIRKEEKEKISFKETLKQQEIEEKENMEKGNNKSN